MANNWVSLSEPHTGKSPTQLFVSFTMRKKLQKNKTENLLAFPYLVMSWTMAGTVNHSTKTEQQSLMMWKREIEALKEEKH